ncbi:MAG: STAS domain-containing protein [Sedimenticola sp.]|nr:STAS domain-containing protein [Sedimenticola sp.]
MNDDVAKSVLGLGSVFTIHDIESWRERFLESLNAAVSCLVLDGADIDQVDGPALQLLASLVLEAKDAGKEIVWEGASDELIASARLIGLSELLGLGLLNTTDSGSE